MSRAWRRFVVLTAAVLVVGGAPATEASSSAISFSGRAYVIGGPMGPQGQPSPARVEGIEAGPLVDTGPLAASGGELDACALSYPTDQGCLVNVPLSDPLNGALRAEVLHATAIGHGNHSSTEASVAEVVLSLPGGGTISATVLRAEAEATCNDGKASLTASSEIADLFLDPDGSGGLPAQQIDVTIPSQTISVGPFNVDITVDKQVQLLSADGSAGDVTVQALRIQFTNPATGNKTDVVVSAAHADVVCPVPKPPCNGADKVTGGGWVPKGGSKANFAIAGRQLTSWGHFNYVDHSTGSKLKATSVGPMTFDGDGFAVITGMASLNGAGSYPFTVKVKDNGQPGRGADQFMLTSVVSQPLTTLSGGNIKFHKPCLP